MKKKFLILVFCLTFILISCDSITQSVNPSDINSSTTAEKLGYTIDNVVLVDNEYCNITIIEAYEDTIWGFTLKVLLENKTSDTTIMFSAETGSINGYEIDPFWAKEVAAGKKANTEISFSSSDIEEAGITSVDMIKLYLRAYDSDNWLDDDYIKETFTLYPTGLSDNEVIIPNRPSNNNEYIVIDNEYCTFIIVNSYMDNIWGYTLTYFIENKTDNLELMFSWDDVSVNGFMIDPFWATSLYSETRKVGTINFYKSDLEENNIIDVNSIEFKLKVYDNNDWLSDNIVESIFEYSTNN